MRGFASDIRRPMAPNRMAHRRLSTATSSPGRSAPTTSSVLRFAQDDTESGRDFVEDHVLLTLERPAESPGVLEQDQRISLRVEQQHPAAVARDPLDLFLRS